MAVGNRKRRTPNIEHSTSSGQPDRNLPGVPYWMLDVECFRFSVLTLTALCCTVLLLTGCAPLPGVAPLLRKPYRTGVIQSGTIRVGEQERSFLFYVPTNLPPHAPLLFALHGSTQSAQQMRVSTGFQFERLADQHGFVVVYPNGYHRHWNDCRKEGSYAAKKLNVDDIGFILALISHFESAEQTDSARVFAMGYSNGGHMAYRLALEMPERITAIAAVAANLPTEENCACKKSRRPIAVMILNGTRDPINPYHGGKVTLFGFGNRGTVRSARASAEYFTQLNELTNAPVVTRIEPTAQFDSTSVGELDWREPGKPEVLLESVEGGGHVVPQPLYRAPLFLGRTTHAINGPEKIWNFFARQMPLDWPKGRVTQVPEQRGR